MARLLLIMPELPQRLGAPYLGQLYLAASLIRAGHEVSAVDLGARFGTLSADELIDEVKRAPPDAVGMTLFTYNALNAYALAERLQGHVRLLIAGGPHVTVRPKEALEMGFDLALVGEGERSLVQALDALDAQGKMERIPGAHWRQGSGPASSPIASLGELPSPHTGVTAFDLSAYWPPGSEEHPIPGGMLTSRGCPARCTFCANYVTGRAFRYRPAEEVVAEMIALREAHDIATVPFWDDAFTANRPRLHALCDAIQGAPELEGITWTCITPANMVKPVDLKRMAAAGCTTINFGIESGDASVLRAIQKGQRPEQVIEAVRAAKGEGMETVVNFMFGFPSEGVAELENTMTLMAELAHYTDYFNSRGVVVPFPGTPIYEQHHSDYGFSRWWLDPEKIPQELSERDPIRALALLEHDPALDVDYFRYTPEVRDAIQSAVRFKAEHNQRRVAERSGMSVDAWRAELGALLTTSQSAQR